MRTVELYQVGTSSNSSNNSSNKTTTLSLSQQGFKASQQTNRHTAVTPTTRTSYCSNYGINRSAGSELATSNTQSSPLLQRRLIFLFDRMTGTLTDEEEAAAAAALRAEEDLERAKEKAEKEHRKWSQDSDMGDENGDEKGNGEDDLADEMNDDRGNIGEESFDQERRTEQLDDMDTDGWDADEKPSTRSQTAPPATTTATTATTTTLQWRVPMLKRKAIPESPTVNTPQV